MLRSGDIFDGRYRLDDQVAKGGMGEVWRATDLTLGRTVAVKVLLPVLLADPDFATRFRSEARMMAALHHPGIVGVYDYGESSPRNGDNGQAGDTAMYMVMQYVDGEPLSERIAQQGRLNVADTMSVVAQAADALHAAHVNGIVHRDVKPSNLLIQPDRTVTLVDFGIARSTALTSITGTNAVPGTALYMAPEQASGQPVSPATDIYSLGAVAYQCLAGRTPFLGDNPLQVAIQHIDEEPPPLPDDVPAGVRALVARALAKEPGQRFATADAFASAARAAAGSPDAVASTLPTMPVIPAVAPDALRDGTAPVRRTAPPAAAAEQRNKGKKGAAVAAVSAVLLGLIALIAALAPTNGGGTPGEGGQGASTAPSDAATGSAPAGNRNGTTPARNTGPGSAPAVPPPTQGTAAPTPAPTTQNTTEAPQTPPPPTPDATPEASQQARPTNAAGG